VIDFRACRVREESKLHNREQGLGEALTIAISVVARYIGFEELLNLILGYSEGVIQQITIGDTCLLNG